MHCRITIASLAPLYCPEVPIYVAHMEEFRCPCTVPSSLETLWFALQKIHRKFNLCLIVRSSVASTFFKLIGKMKSARLFMDHARTGKMANGSAGAEEKQLGFAARHINRK